MDTTAMSPLDEAKALIERRIVENRKKLQGPKDEYERGYRSGYLNAMKFAHSELRRLERA